MNHDEEKSKKELTEWLTRFREAMNFLPDGVAIMDNVLFLDSCNPMAEKHLGLDLGRDRDMRITNLVRDPAFIDYVILGKYDEPLEMKFNDRYLVLQIIPFGNRRQIIWSRTTRPIPSGRKKSAATSSPMPRMSSWYRP